MAARPIVLPEPYTGEGSWEEWTFHFENVAVVNGWDEAQKLQFLKVRLTGRAQKALQRLPEVSCNTYTAARSVLQERFEPSSRRTRYQAEFQTRRKRGSKGWADFADDLKFLAEKGFPQLQEEAKELLAVNTYLQQLNQPQVAFSVRQRRPRTLDEAVSATLEMESYISTRMVGLSVVSVGQGTTDNNVATGKQDILMRLVERLAERIEALEQQQTQWRDSEECARSELSAPAAVSSVAMRCEQRGYRLDGKVDGVDTSFLLDTGAAYTLIRNDAWERIAAENSRDLEQWTGTAHCGRGWIHAESARDDTCEFESGCRGHFSTAFSGESTVYGSDFGHGFSEGALGYHRFGESRAAPRGPRVCHTPAESSLWWDGYGRGKCRQ